MYNVHSDKNKTKQEMITRVIEIYICAIVFFVSVSEQVIIQLALAVKLISLRTEIWLFQNPRTNDFKLMR